MSIICRLVGHRQTGSQAWASIGNREGDGAWLRVRTFCVRCGSQVAAGSLYLSAQEARAIVAKATGSTT